MGVATFLRGRERNKKKPETTVVPEIAKDDNANVLKYICPTCGKNCKIKMAYNNHVKKCRG